MPASRRILVISMLLLAASSIKALQQPEPNQVAPNENTGPSYEQPAPQDKAVWPMVDVDRQQNKSTVDVHVPIFFDMTNHNDKDSGRAKLDLSVLQGLVTVNKDRVPDANGQMTGPLKVTVFGIPVYQGKSPALPTAQRAGSELDNSVTQTRSNLNDRAQDVSSQVATNARPTNERLMSGLADLFGRITSVVRQASQAVINQSSGNYLQPAREQRQQQEQPLPYLQQQQQQQHQQQQPRQPLDRVENNQIERLPIRSAREEPILP